MVISGRKVYAMKLLPQHPACSSFLFPSSLFPPFLLSSLLLQFPSFLSCLLKRLPTSVQCLVVKCTVFFFYIWREQSVYEFNFWHWGEMIPPPV